MEKYTILITLLATLALGTISPGPSFIMVARMAISSSRSSGVFAALGMGTGGLLFAVAALLGLHGFLLAVPSAYWLLKILGGCYLIYLGLHINLRANQSIFFKKNNNKQYTIYQSFISGLITQISNPKTAIIYASVFTTILPTDLTLYFKIIVASLIFSIETTWYIFVALTLSSARPRRVYLRYKKWVDWAAGTAMMTIGGKLIWSARYI